MCDLNASLIHLRIDVHNIEHAVTGVCLIGLSTVGSVLSFVTYLLYGVDNREPDLIRIDVREKNNRSLSIFVYETDIVHVAIGPNTPPKIVLFESYI